LLDTLQQGQEGLRVGPGRAHYSPKVKTLGDTWK
jgi:hypothetical protein